MARPSKCRRSSGSGRCRCIGSRRAAPSPRPVDVDRRLTQALVEHPGNELAAAALRLQRACGLRIGELLDLELDCVHELPGHGSWLKVPLGKLDTERMVPIDAEILALIDHITQIAAMGGRCPTPATAGPRSSCSPTT